MSESGVKVHLRSVGKAPALKKPVIHVDGRKSIYEVEKRLRKMLQYEDSIFLFCGSGFSPTPDQIIQDLFDNFETGGELVVNYGYQEAWG